MSHNVAAYLAHVPAGSHFAHIHQDARSLIESLSVYVEAGLNLDQSVVLVLSSRHAELLLEHLRQSMPGLDEFQQSGQLTVCESQATLARVMRDGMPEKEAFYEVMTPIIDAAVYPKRRGLRVYGEMVNDLWRAGNAAAAIRMEELWGALAQRHRFCLYCGFTLDGLDEASYDGPIGHVGCAHSEILVDDDEDRLLAAVDAASRDVLGVSLSVTLGGSRSKDNAGDERLPSGRRTVLWLKKNMPGTVSTVLKRARHYLGPATGMPTN